MPTSKIQTMIGFFLWLWLRQVVIYEEVVTIQREDNSKCQLKTSIIINSKDEKG